MQRDSITVDWLNQALSHTLGKTHITSFDVEDVGAGTGFGGNVLRLQLSYDEETNAPRSVIVKLPIGNAETLEAMRVQGMLLREALFYQEIEPQLNVRTPKPLFVRAADDDFEIIMEDLGDIKRPELMDMTRDELEMSITEVAKLHARFWNQPEIHQAWLQNPLDGTDESRQSNLLAFERALQVLRNYDGDHEYAIDCVERIKANVMNSPKEVPLPNPVTLVHGDYHANNIHCTPNEVSIFDWQLVSKGTPLMDVANLLVSSSDPELHRERQDEFLEIYGEALAEQGVDYSLNKMKRQYRDALFFTFMKFIVIIGTIDDGAQGRDELFDTTVPKMDKVARHANAKVYTRLMPLIFLVMRVQMFFRKLFRRH
ncbi:MAG: phosphotransferase [Pseudomonadota bacterium]